MRQQFAPRIAMKRRVRPIADAYDETMLNGIIVNIINVSGEIGFVADRVLPVTPLPKREIAVAISPDRHPRREQRAAEMPFDAPPPSRIVGISFWQGEDRMKMVWQNHNRFDRKRPLSPRHAKGFA